MALQGGLDPDKTAPEDVLLLSTDKDGVLLAVKEYEKARARLNEIDHLEKEKAKAANGTE